MNEEVAAVRAANQSFYRALAGGDLVEMESVWLHGTEVVCIHPGWERLRGWDAIRKVWAGIFSSQGPVPVEPADVRVAISGDMAWIDCDEVLRRDHGIHLELVRVVATNVFVRHEDRWRMILHHASPVPPSQAPPSSTS